MKNKTDRKPPHTAEDSIECLQTINRLEVGPLLLEKRRLRVPYTVLLGGKTSSTDLIYRFEEDVFIPDEPASINLANMIAVQAALNYGLFCRDMVFHGIFDPYDRQFIRDMARHTAREIFVNKFLRPNPFLEGPAAEIQPFKRDSYLLANIIFDPESSGDLQVNEGLGTWDVKSSRHAVLSSGGKDSLLSFGLMREIGHEVHPVFINESGRHWFTALNAYKHFSKNIPFTARVWTNADRVFNWMLRNLSFVRKNFSSIRSDEYPIRLWTVAVFLFGALPILRKRRIGRLIIGNEFDTSRRLSYHGIPHYDGLYDQSRYFDNGLTRYFYRKGWMVSQFSILRPMSEILIEKTLVERYPDLQHHQVSCHAAHKGKDRILPCGSCEKCRRIVGMIMAIGADPTYCGYTDKQIGNCLKSLFRKGIHQETVGIEHLSLLLKERGFIDDASIGGVRGQRRPELMNLRFDPEKSPIEGIPADIREALYRIFLEHSDGSVKRSGREWIHFDLLSEPALMRPYPFEKPLRRSYGSKIDPKDLIQRESGCMIGDLTWPEAKRRFKEMDMALLPVGSLEQHGPHLPLDSDAFDALYLARQVAEACADPKPLVLPLISYGVSYHHEDFSGTISISPDTLSRLVYEIGMSAARHGTTKLIIINGHGGNSPALHFAAQMVNRDAHIFTCVDTGETSDPDINELTETPNDVHAGEIETSTTMATRPHLVRKNETRKFIPKFSSRFLDFSSRRSVGWYAHTSKISPYGVLGDPTKASREKGEHIWELMIRNLVEFIEDLKGLSLDEIYQKRY